MGVFFGRLNVAMAGHKLRLRGIETAFQPRRNPAVSHTVYGSGFG